MLLIKCLGLEAQMFNGVLDFLNDVFVLDEFFNVVQGKRKRKREHLNVSVWANHDLARSFVLYKFIHIHFCCSYQFDF